MEEKVRITEFQSSRVKSVRDGVCRSYRQSVMLFVVVVATISVATFCFVECAPSRLKMEEVVNDGPTISGSHSSSDAVVCGFLSRSDLERKLELRAARYSYETNWSGNARESTYDCKLYGARKTGDAPFVIIEYGSLDGYVDRVHDKYNNFVGLELNKVNSEGEGFVDYDGGTFFWKYKNGANLKMTFGNSARSSIDLSVQKRIGLTDLFSDLVDKVPQFNKTAGRRSVRQKLD